jgi:hypothetical protein
MHLPTHEPPDSTSRVVCSLGPEWIWFAVSILVFVWLLYNQLWYLDEATMPMPVFVWFEVSVWVGWGLVMLVGLCAALYSTTTTVTVDPARETVSTASRVFFLVPWRRTSRPFQQVAAVRCRHEGVTSNTGIRYVAVLFKVVIVTFLFLLILELLSLFPLWPIVVILVVAGEVMLDWTIPTARLLFMDGRTWPLTRGADHEVYWIARRVARLVQVSVIN